MACWNSVFTSGVTGATAAICYAPHPSRYLASEYLKISFIATLLRTSVATVQPEILYVHGCILVPPRDARLQERSNPMQNQDTKVVAVAPYGMDGPPLSVDEFWAYLFGFRLLQT